MDNITVISQTTAERNQETIDLFNQCKPLLDKGIPLGNAVKRIVETRSNIYRQKWYKDLKKYAKEQGY